MKTKIIYASLVLALAAVVGCQKISGLGKSDAPANNAASEVNEIGQNANMTEAVADRLTYENKSWGLAFSYPSSGQIKEEHNVVNFTSPGWNFTLGWIAFPEDMPASAILATPEGRGVGAVTKSENMTIASGPALWQEFADIGGKTPASVGLVRDHDKFVFNAEFSGVDKKADMDLFKELLKTVRFL